MTKEEMKKGMLANGAAIPPAVKKWMQQEFIGVTPEQIVLTMKGIINRDFSFTGDIDPEVLSVIAADEISFNEVMNLVYLKYDVDVPFAIQRITTFMVMLKDSPDHEIINEDDWIWYLKLMQLLQSIC